MANAIFWLTFGIIFIATSSPYKPHEKLFEETGPEYIYFGRAQSALKNEQPTSLYLTVHWVQWPSFYAAKPFVRYCNKKGLVVDDLFLGISVGGHLLLIVCVISFLQWYLIGFFIDLLRRRIGRVGRVAPVSMGRRPRP
jgi:hypothetical protein